MDQKTPAPLRPAATILLLQDGAAGWGSFHGGAPPSDRFRLGRLGISGRHQRSR